ncbi:MAG: OmpA family protein [Flavobacterium sp.]|nr:OmpA family protein [Flavobacterium sp.]
MECAGVSFPPPGVIRRRVLAPHGEVPRLVASGWRNGRDPIPNVRGGGARPGLVPRSRPGARHDDGVLRAWAAHRAEAVTEYLVSKGVDYDKIIFHGFGSSHPIATNETVEGRSRNRRVEILLQNPKK